MSTETDYELTRLANIQKNNQLLQELGLASVFTPPPTTAKKPSHKKKKVKVEKPEVDESVKRKSLRVRGLDPEGAAAREAEAVKIEVEERKKKERIVGKIPLLEKNGGDEEKLLKTLGGMKRKAEDEDENEVKLEFTNAYSKLTIPIPEGTVKVTKDMIYTIAMHPSVDKIIAGVGDKTGALAFWDVSETLEKCERGEEEEEPVVAMFKPHARPVSKVMYHTTDLKKIFTSSYDGSVRCMDVDAQHFDEVYVHPEETMVTSFDIDPTGRTVWFSVGDGTSGVRDLRTPTSHLHTLSLKKLNTVHINPITPHLLLTAGLDNTYNVFDIRKMVENDEGFVEALRSYRHGKSVNSAFWDASGKHVLSLSFDDTIRVLRDEGEEGKEIKIRHNNNTGRWIQKFKAVWKETPDESLFVVGNMHRSVDIYSGTGSPLSILSSPDKLTAIPAVNVFHPSPAVRMIVSGNASGRMTVWI